MSGFDLCIEELALDPVFPSHLYTGTTYSAGAQSFDGGATWMPTTAPIPSRAIVAHPQFALTRYGIGSTSSYLLRVLVTNDAGFTWSVVTGAGLPSQGLPGLGFNALSIDPGVGRLFLGTGEGLFRSGNGGESWLPVDAIPPVPARSVIFNAADSQIIAGTTQGIYRFPSPAFTLATRLDIRDGSTRIRRLWIDRNEPSTVYAGTSDYDGGGVPHGRIFRSRDSGASWSLIGDSNVIGAMAIGPQGDLYTARSREKIVYRLPAGSDEWVVLPRSFRSIDTIATDPQVAGTLYLAADLGMYRSRDFGMNWEWLPDFPAGGTYTIAVDSRGSLYVGTVGGGFWKSDDRGDHWRMLESEQVATFKIELSPADDRTLYRYARDLWTLEMPFLFWRSEDGGVTWRSSLVPGKDFVTDFAPDPHDANSVWISTANRGVFHSNDGGTTWIAAPARLPASSASAIAIDNAGIVHVGTFENGCWELRESARGRPVPRR